MRRAIITATALLALAGTLFGVLHGSLADTGDRLWPLSWIAWPVVGWIILVRRPENRVGSACLLIGVVQGMAFFLGAIVLDVDVTIAAWVELAFTVMGVIPWLVVIWVVITFPTGTYAGRMERFLGRALVVVGSWALLGFLISPAPLSETGLDNPLAAPPLSGLAVITNDSGFLLVVALGIGAIIALIGRWRRSSGVEREQYRWLLFGASVFFTVAGLGQILPADSSADIVWLIGGSSIPVSIGVAVVRYRLYEIGRIVSRTVSYALVVGLLAAVFFVVVTALTSVLPGGSDLAVAGSTLAVAALFNPARRRIQGWVDRRFNRSRYDAERVMTGFASSLRDRVDPDAVVDGWVGVVSETMHPSAAGVWVRDTTALPRNDFGTVRR